MKIGIISDTHWGFFSTEIINSVRKNRKTSLKVLLNLEKRIMENIINLFKEKGIRIIVHLGDAVDKANNVDQVLLSQIYFSELASNFDEVIFIRGNHDPKKEEYFKAIELQGIRTVYNEYEEILPKVYAVPHIPTLKTEDLDKIVEEILEKEEVTTIMFHYTPSLFKFSEVETVVSEYAVEKAKEHNVKLLFGHIHTYADKDNVSIIGAILKRSRAPSDEVVAIYDTETQNLTRIDLSEIRRKVYVFDNEDGDGVLIGGMEKEIMKEVTEVDTIGNKFLQLGFVPGFELYLREQGESEEMIKKYSDLLKNLM